MELVAPSWAREAQLQWNQIIESIELHYPGTRELMLAASDDELNQWRGAGEDVEAGAAVLERMGLLSRDGDNFVMTAALKSLRSIGVSGEMPRRSSILASHDDTDIVALARKLIARGEGHNVEFTQTGRINVHTGKQDEAMEAEIVRAVVGFLNSDGGDLLIGVCDDGRIAGIDDDIEITRNLDFYQQWLVGSLLSSKLSKSVVSQHVRAFPVSLEDHRIMLLRITRCDEPVWAKVGREEHLLVRNGNRTDRLDGHDVTAFIRNRTK